MTTSTTKKLITAALAVATLAVGSLAVTGDAMAKGKHGGWHGGWHGGHGGWHHRWHGRRWHGRFFYTGPVYGYADECYFVRKKYSGKLIRICPDYYRY